MKAVRFRRGCQSQSEQPRRAWAVAKMNGYFLSNGSSAEGVRVDGSRFIADGNRLAGCAPVDMGFEQSEKLGPSLFPPDRRAGHPCSVRQTKGVGKHVSRDLGLVVIQNGFPGLLGDDHGTAGSEQDNQRKVV